jgi:hypothetical protein
LDFRKRIIAGYDSLFNNADSDESGLQSDFSEQTQFGKQWGWYQSIYGLAKGDITKFDIVTGYRLTQCLTYLTFEKQKNEIEQRQLNKHLNKTFK